MSHRRHAELEISKCRREREQPRVIIGNWTLPEAFQEIAFCVEFRPVQVLEQSLQVRLRTRVELEHFVLDSVIYRQTELVHQGTVSTLCDDMARRQAIAV